MRGWPPSRYACSKPRAERVNDRHSSADGIDVAVIGAGAAGLAAARELRESGLTVALLEASHRIGGRAYTEEVAPGVFFDLGCHWMHSASRNPFVALADHHGFHYRKETWSRAMYLGDRWATPAEQDQRADHFDRVYETIDRLADQDADMAVLEVTPRESRWSALFDYWFSIVNSVDPDQCSVRDVSRYLDTYENWPLREGYGNLLARVAADQPVTLNCKVERIEHGHTLLRLHTTQGVLVARRVLVTVSTGVLNAGDILFDPPLPDWKQTAIAALPLGNHNRICLHLDGNPFGDDHPRAFSMERQAAQPMGIQLRPFGYDHVIGFTGGRFATWLERAGMAASVDLVTEHLASALGNDIPRRIVGHTVTAWGGDPWVKGAYSAALPGAGEARSALARDVDGRLFFAGEATHPHFFATCHGAWLSGLRAAQELRQSLGAGQRST